MHLNPFPFDMAWVAIILCGVPIILEAVIGLVTAFDIKADVLVSLALDRLGAASGRTSPPGEVAFIMQLGGLLEDLTVARARAGIEKLVHLTPQHRPAACRTDRSKSSPPSRYRSGTCSGCCRARPSRWTASSSPDRPRSTRRS